MKCLLADDSASMVELIRHHLKLCEIENLEVIIAKNGTEAVTLFQEHQPDVMLLDYVMPDMTGLEVLKVLKGDQNSLPVVMVTSFNDVEAIVDAINYGAQNYLLKDRLSPGSLNLAIKDAVQKHQMQQRLRFQTEEVERFTRTVAHDLKDQISGVFGVLNYLREHADSFDETQLRMVQTGCDSARKMHEFVSDLLTYALAGKREQNFEAFSLQEVVDDAKRNLAEQITSMGAKIEQKTPLPDVIGEKRMLMQVFQNLISNAMKYRGESAPHIAISLQTDAQYWHLCVADNGKGISQEYQDKIFNAFEQAECSKSIEGVGVGLATCRRVVQDIHGGKIWVESEQGSGATFHFTLPKNLVA